MAALAGDRVAAPAWPSSKTAARRTWRRPADGPSARSASPAPSASIRRRTSARSETAAPSSPTTRALADRIRRLRNGGQTDRYHHQEPGINSRLDEMQAAILRARLPFLAGWTARRRALAGCLSRGADGSADRRPARARRRPRVPSLRGADRRSAAARSAGCRSISPARGIETLVHYPVPIPHQPALAAAEPADCPRATAACDDARVAAAAPRV